MHSRSWPVPPCFWADWTQDLEPRIAIRGEHIARSIRGDLNWRCLSQQTSMEPLGPIAAERSLRSETAARQAAMRASNRLRESFCGGADKWQGPCCPVVAHDLRLPTLISHNSDSPCQNSDPSTIGTSTESESSVIIETRDMLSGGGLRRCSARLPVACMLRPVPQGCRQCL